MGRQESFVLCAKAVIVVNRMAATKSSDVLLAPSQFGIAIVLSTLHSSKLPEDHFIQESAGTQVSFLEAPNAAACLLTNSCKLIGSRPVRVSTSSDLRA